MSRKIASVTLVLTMMFVTGFASLSQTATAAEIDTARATLAAVAPGASADVSCLAAADAEQVNGEGWLLCAGAIGGGLMLGGTLIGAVVGAAIVACGCADYLDEWFDTEFQEACSYNQ